jgi:hypothetical protein
MRIGVHVRLNEIMRHLALAPMQRSVFRQCAWLVCRPGLHSRRIQAQSPMRHHLRARGNRYGA